MTYLNISKKKQKGNKRWFLRRCFHTRGRHDRPVSAIIQPGEVETGIGGGNLLFGKFIRHPASFRLHRSFQLLVSTFSTINIPPKIRF